MSLVAGTRLGPYEIQSAIGAGDMGYVHKAGDSRPPPNTRHATLGRHPHYVVTPVLLGAKSL